MLHILRPRPGISAIFNHFIMNRYINWAGFIMESGDSVSSGNPYSLGLGVYILLSSVKPRKKGAYGYQLFFWSNFSLFILRGVRQPWEDVFHYWKRCIDDECWSDRWLNQCLIQRLLIVIENDLSCWMTSNYFCIFDWYAWPVHLVWPHPYTKSTHLFHYIHFLLHRMVWKSPTTRTPSTGNSLKLHLASSYCFSTTTSSSSITTAMSGQRFQFSISKH